MITQYASSIVFNTAAGGPAFFSGTSGTAYNGASTNSSYPTSAFEYGETNSLMLRIVACGLRVRYQGTVLNAAGDWYGIQTNPRQDLSGFDVGGINKFPGNKTGSFKSGQWHTYCRHITSQQDFVYLQFNSTTASWVDALSGQSVLEDDTYYMGIIFSGIAAQPYEIDATVHAELVGPNLDYTGITTPHRSGTEDVIHSFSKLRVRDRTTKDHVSDVPSTSKLSKIFGIIKDGVEKEFPIIGSGIKLFNTLFDK
jgi:hypothetical protein